MFMRSASELVDPIAQQEPLQQKNTQCEQCVLSLSKLMHGQVHRSNNLQSDRQLLGQGRSYWLQQHACYIV